MDPTITCEYKNIPDGSKPRPTGDGNNTVNSSTAGVTITGTERVTVRFVDHKFDVETTKRVSENGKPIRSDDTSVRVKDVDATHMDARVLTG